MNIWRQGLRLFVACAAPAGLYLGLGLLIHQPMSAPLLVGLILLGAAIEGMWIYIRWLSPLRATFGDPDQEIALVRALERELSRSLRYKAPLVVVALHGKRGLTKHAIATMLRFSDIVIRGRNQHMVILMTETPLANARVVVERMIERLPVRGAAIADEHVITPATSLAGFGARHHKQQSSTHGPTLALLQGLRLGIFRSEARSGHQQPTVLYELSPDDLIAANATTNARSMEDLTQHVA
jgi:hypothetical protein